VTLILGSLAYIGVIVGLLALVRGAGQQRKRGESAVIRAFDRFYEKHPKKAFAAMLVVCCVVLYVAHSLDSDNSAILQMQMMSTNSRAAT